MRVGSNFLPPTNRGFSMYLKWSVLRGWVERVWVERVCREGGLRGWVERVWVERVWVERVCREGLLRGWDVKVCDEGRIEFLAANQQRVFDVSGDG